MAGSVDAWLDAYDRGALSRRTLLSRLVALVGAGGAASAFAQDADDEPTFQAREVDHIALAVSDVKRSAAFYQKHLGLKISRASGDQNCFLDCGHNFVALFKSDSPGLHHFSFGLSKYDVGEAVERIEGAGLEPRREGGRVYFPDPDGIVLQVSQSRGPAANRAG